MLRAKIGWRGAPPCHDQFDPARPDENITTSHGYDAFGRITRVQAPTTGTISDSYDGLLRLTDGVESPGASYRYAYDLAANRTDVWTDGTLTAHQDYNAANQVVGWTYDDAGNLTNDGTTAYTCDPLNRMTQRGSTSYTYNGDGVLVYDGTTRYTQDLAAPLSQVLQTSQDSATTDYTIRSGGESFVIYS